MNIIEVVQGLKQGKLYQRPGMGTFYIYAKDNQIFLKSLKTDPVSYNLHIDELESNEWYEVTLEELKEDNSVVINADLKNKVNDWLERNKNISKEEITFHKDKK